MDGEEEGDVSRDMLRGSVHEEVRDEVREGDESRLLAAESGPALPDADTLPRKEEEEEDDDNGVVASKERAREDGESNAVVAVFTIDAGPRLIDPRIIDDDDDVDLVAEAEGLFQLCSSPSSRRCSAP